VKEEDIKKFTHKFAREKVDYEDKILELQDTIVMLRDKKQSLEEEIEELEQQNRKLLVERNDLYECLQYQK
jgi:phage shock protein A